MKYVLSLLVLICEFISFTEEDSVQVDESLFQDMDDLDLEEDLEEAGD